MKVIFDEDKDEEFLEIQLSENDLKALLSYKPLDEWVDCIGRKPINVFLRRGANAVSKREIKESDQ